LTALTHAQVLGYALTAGWPRNNANMITVIANFESGDNPDAVGDQTLSKYGSIGLTQDFTGAHTPAELKLGSGPWTPALVDRLKDPLTNMAAALIIYKEQGFTAWSTYNNLHTGQPFLTLLRTVEGLTPVMPGPVPVPHPVPTPLPGPDPTKSQDYLDKLGNVAPGVTQAILRADAATICPVGMCLKEVRTWWNIPLGAPTAIAAWRAVPTTERHSFYTPPAGVAVFWSGGSSGDGHVALSLGGGKVRTTDFPTAGKVATLSTSEIHVLDPGLVYLGWTETLNGQRIYQRPGA
jgi:hypothetical protein